jgi:hypothetical protein
MMKTRGPTRFQRATMQPQRQAAWDRAFRARAASRRPQPRPGYVEELLDDAATAIKERQREREDTVVDLEALIRDRTRGEQSR